MTVPARTSLPVAPALLEIQAPVRERLLQVPEEMWRIVKADAPIIEAVNAHLQGLRGKMFRPTLLLLASALDGRPEPRAVTLAAIAELVHLASVVHDDSVDHSTLRRGMPTVNALFSHQVAVLGGDYLYSRAIAALVGLGDLEPLRILTNASNEMTLGELRQLASYDALAFSEDDYETLIKAKTASLLSAVCELGALAGAPAHRAAMARFGLRLGMAFQVQDDLLDYTEDAGTIGKPAGNDLREHKVTLPLILALPRLGAPARSRVEALFADPTPADAQIAEVIGIVAEHGGLDDARRRGDEYAQDAEQALAGLPAGPAAEALGDAIAYVMNRRS